jgi:hypothetical protein
MLGPNPGSRDGDGMPVTPNDCPLCARPGARVKTPPAGAGAVVSVHIECPLHCGTVVVEVRFLAQHWPRLPAGERATLVRWLQATRETRGPLPLILAEDSYHLYLREAEETAARSSQ